jgi:hypothetical protein
LTNFFQPSRDIKRTPNNHNARFKAKVTLAAINPRTLLPNGYAAIQDVPRRIDLLSRPKDSAHPGVFVNRYSPQPQNHIERIDAEH